ncbi:tripartite tricarboxylate transporter substrate binding protein [Ramlibacter sp.]|uniref:tripartite tricarboxylate transporter substrate binding protein n=1 Tax=Ramlibacter sp. TaxID=1917967 RepID=UPI0017FCF147|nr:tripartite tricarboxylate transporter substrate binding protein [Ramlibacter sp.]MBA2672876.1 tripartite tricarboxylate transporter substrate binding protein [Ramlibacter sp.]
MIRAVLRRAGLAVLLAAALAGPAGAQSDAVRIVVPAPAGGSLDATARILAQRMTALTGEPHVVENKPGANTQIGNEYVARAAPDGRTLLYAGLSLAINPLLQKGAARNLLDLRPVIAISREPYSLVVSSALKLPSVRELGRVAAARQGGLNCAAPPGVMLLGCEQLRHKYPNVNVIPYPGVAPALGALAGGHVDVVFVPMESAARVVQGRLADIVATSDTHTLPGVPTITAVWPDFAMESIQGVSVPVGTPDARVRQLNEQLARILGEPETQERLRLVGHDPLKAGTPEDYGRLLADLSRRYGAVIDKLGLAAR